MEKLPDELENIIKDYVKSLCKELVNNNLIKY